MAAFDPAAYADAALPGGPVSGFDPGAYADAAGAPKANDSTTSAAQAGLEHYGNMATGGYLAQLQAKAAGPMSRALDLVTGNADYKAALNKSPAEYFFNDPEDQKNYLKARDENIARMGTEAKEHPYASAAGSVAGAITSGAAMNAVAPINAATKLGRVAQAARGGAIVGALSNPGDTQGQVADGFQLDDRAKNSATGAATGGVFQGGIEGISSVAKGVSGLPDALTGKAEERAFKSSGAMLKDYRQAAGQDRVNELGRYMIDNDLVKPGMSVSDIQTAAEALQNKHGETIGGILKGLDDSGAAAPTHESIASAIEQQALPMKGLKTAQPTYNALTDVAGDIRSMGKDNPNGSFQGAQDVKQFVSDQIAKSGGWKTPNPSEKNLALRQVYSTVKDSLEESAGKAAQSSGDQDLLNKYVSAKTGYRNAGDISRIAEDQTLRQNANRFFAPSDYASGIGGAMIGASTGEDFEHKVKNAATGLGLGLASKAVRYYGTPVVSAALDRAGGMLGKTGVSSPLVETGINALQRGPTAVAAAEGAAGNGVRKLVPFPAAAGTQQPAANRSPAKGEDLWAQQGLGKLGIQDDGRLMNDPKAKQLLIQASDLAPGSRAMKQIQDQLRNWRNK